MYDECIIGTLKSVGDEKHHIMGLKDLFTM